MEKITRKQFIEELKQAQGKNIVFNSYFKQLTESILADIDTLKSASPSMLHDYFVPKNDLKVIENSNSLQLNGSFLYLDNNNYYIERAIDNGFEYNNVLVVEDKKEINIIVYIIPMYQSL